jgi:hypothetical protein
VPAPGDLVQADQPGPGEVAAGVTDADEDVDEDRLPAAGNTEPGTTDDQIAALEVRG